MSNTSRELSGQKFKLSSAADELLQAYLKGIRSHFAKYPDGEEIYSDLEQRIAEKLSQDKGKQIEIEDVQKLIAEMGEVADFTAELKAAEGEVDYLGRVLNRFKFTRLKRDVDNQKIAGVCAGIANYLDIDPAIIRIGFCLTLFILVMSRSPFLWIPIAAYLALWLSMPEAKSAVEKLEMKGKKVTLAEVEQEMEQKVSRLIEQEIAQEMSAFQRVVSLPVQVTNQSLRLGVSGVRALFPWVVRGVGLSILIGCVAAFIVISTVASILVISSDSPIVGVPLTLIASQQLITTMTLLSYAILALPIIATMALGISLVRMRNSFRTIPVLIGSGFWVFAVIAFTVLSLANANQVQQRIRENPGIFTTITTTYNLDSFTQIKAEGEVRVRVMYAEAQEIEVDALTRDMAELSMSSNGGVLTITRNDSEQMDLCLFCVRHLPLVTIYTPDVTNIQVGDRASVRILDLQPSELNVGLSGRSAFDFSGKLAELNLTMLENSSASLDGTVENFDIDMSGHSYLYADQFAARDLSIHIADSSYARVNASISLTGVAEDDAAVTYYGAAESQIDAQEDATVSYYLAYQFGHTPEYARVSTYLGHESSLKELRKLITDKGKEIGELEGGVKMYEFQLEQGYTLEVRVLDDEILYAAISSHGRVDRTFQLTD